MVKVPKGLYFSTMKNNYINLSHKNRIMSENKLNFTVYNKMENKLQQIITAQRYDRTWIQETNGNSRLFEKNILKSAYFKILRFASHTKTLASKCKTFKGVS